ncbi:hypothetical protein M407DRAFT_225580, partial [Tulasnella calospora MUT 4182]
DCKIFRPGPISPNLTSGCARSLACVATRSLCSLMASTDQLAVHLPARYRSLCSTDDDKRDSGSTSSSFTLSTSVGGGFLDGDEADVDPVPPGTRRVYRKLHPALLELQFGFHSLWQQHRIRVDRKGYAGVTSSSVNGVRPHGEGWAAFGRGGTVRGGGRGSKVGREDEEVEELVTVVPLPPAVVSSSETSVSDGGVDIGCGGKR